VSFETPFCQTKTTVSLGVGKKATYTFSLYRGTQTPYGTYTAIAKVLYDGNTLDSKEMEFELEPRFEIGVISQSSLVIGKKGTLTVEIKNTGNTTGEAKVKVKLLDLVDEEKVVWLEPKEVGSLTFRLQVPTDFEDGTYGLVARCEWSGVSKGKLSTETLSFIRIVGIKINVAAELDKAAYREGEMATLTLTVTNLSDGSLGTLNLLAKVKFNEYAATQTFTLLPATYSLTFPNFPIHHSGQKLNFGIYSADDRAIWLDAIYVREGGTLTITTDKQRYNQGDTVTLTVSLQEQGTVSLITPGEPATATLGFNGSGSQTFKFKLPSQMLTGSYYIHYFLLPTSYFSLPIDVQGIEVAVKEAWFDKEGYVENERFRLVVSLDVTKGFEGMIKAWIVDDRDNWVKVYEKEEVFKTGRQNYEIAATITTTTATATRQSLRYGIYLGTQTLVISGRKDINIYNISKEIGKVIEKDGLRVEIMPNGLSKNAGFDFHKVAQDSILATLAWPPTELQTIGVWEFIIWTEGVEIREPLKVSYALWQLPGRIIKDSVKAYYIKDGNWELVEKQDVDGEKLTFYLSHLSLVGICGKKVEDLNKVIVYPNPANEKVTFGDNLPHQIKVRIFNIVGEEVYEYEGASTGGKWTWSLQNKDNEKVASGIYIYVISTNDGDKKVGKIGVVR